jgi:hypothetical protein
MTKRNIQRVRIAANGDIRINRISVKQLNAAAKQEITAVFGNKVQKRKVPNSFLLACMRNEAELREWYENEVETEIIADQIVLAKKMMAAEEKSEATAC